ncbi:MAG: hypothetical protein WAL63_16635 [Solirubrobacteraceae bacterium]
MAATHSTTATGASSGAGGTPARSTGSTSPKLGHVTHKGRSEIGAVFTVTGN